MKELQNFVYRHMDALKHHKRYLAMLTALSMLVTFIVPLILVEPADSMTGILVCNKTVHTHNAECYDGDTLVCDIEEHIHTNECYKKVSLLSLKGEASSGTPHADNINVSNAGGGQNEDGSYTSGNAHEFADGTGWYNPAEVSLYTLLFGELDQEAISANKAHWVEPGASLDANLQKASKEFFLGFASDFCAFIEGDFIAYDADAEGRMFVGGDLIFNGNSEVGEWNYQVGAGDYGHFDPISQTDEYGDLTGFASGIIGGKVYRLGTMGTGASANINAAPPLTGVLDGKGKRHVNGYDVFLYPEEGAYKRFVVGNLKDSLHLDEDYVTMGDGVSKDVPYSTSCNHLYYNSNCAICSSKTDHDYLGNVNELSQFYIYDDVSTILEKTFDTVRARADNLGQMEAKNVKIIDKKLILDASDIGDAETAYFKIDQWGEINDVEIIVPPNRVLAHDDYYTPGVETISELDLNIIISCEADSVSLKGMTTYVRPSNEELNVEKHQISKRGEDNSTNNHPLSSNIVYNFYKATNVNFTNNCNLNGTILAPNADVTSPQRCPGHLSGAMIAKSFEGGLEFGYRPYRGGVDVLGLSAGYEVPVDKVVAGATSNHLPGAIFAVKEDNKILNLFESSEKTDFAVIPSKVDFTGKTLYQAEKFEQNENANIVEDKDSVNVNNATIKAPLTIAAYKDAECTSDYKINTDTTIPVLGKFYIKTNQKVNITQNPQIYCDNNPQVVEAEGEDDDVDYVYTVYLNSPITDVTKLTVNASTVATSNFETGIVEINFTPMTLTVNPTNIELDSGADVSGEFKYELSNLPEQNDTGKITYKYYINNTEIKNPNGAFKVTSEHVGVLPIVVEAYYAETDDATPRLIAKASNNVTVTKENFQMPELTFNVPDSVISGEDLEISVDGLDNVENKTVTYYFYSNGKEFNNTNGIFSTENIVGNDLSVKAVVEINDNDTIHTMTLYDTVTVNFPENIGLTVEPSEYVVGVDNNDDIIYTLTNIPSYSNVQFYYNDGIIYSNYFNDAVNEVSYTYNNAKLIGTIPVYAVISSNGLTKKIYFNSADQSNITGKYKDFNLDDYIAETCEIGKEFKVTIPELPNGYVANVTFLGETKQAWGDGGTKEVSFYPQTEGTYEVKVTIKFDNNAEQTILQGKWVTVTPRQVVSGPSEYTGTITFGGTFLPGNNITATLNTDADPNDVEWIVYYYYESNTLASGTGTTANFTPQGVGDITYVFRETSGKEIARKTAKINALFSITNVGNGNHRIQLAHINEKIGAVLEFRVKDLASNTEKTLSDDCFTIENQSINIDTTSLGNGNFEFYINVKLEGGVETEWNSSFTNSNLVTASALMSLKRDARVETNTLTIYGDVSDSEEYDGIKLIVSDYAKDQYSKDAYVVDVKFYSGDELIGTKKGYTVQSETIQSTTGENQNQTRNYIDINVADIENADNKPITKFEVIVSEGWLNINSYIPRIRTKGTMATKTSGSGFKLAQNESKEIELGSWGEKLESIVLDVYSGGRVKYTLFDSSGAEIADCKDKEVAIDKDGKVKIDGNNLENVSKVKITAINSDLVVNQYSINKYVTEKIEDTTGIINNELTVQNTYTIVEMDPPTGYKKTEDVVSVEVTEVVYLNEVETNNYLTYPAHVKTTIKAYKDDINNPIFTTEMDVKYRTYEDGVNTKVDPYTRIIEIGETEPKTVFTVTTDLENNVTVKVGDNTVVSNVSSIHEFEYNGKNYCFDPSSKMIVSVPETHITFENTKGILFRKVNDNGAAVKDVQIDLFKDDTKITDTTDWNWVKGTTSEWIFEFEDLTQDAIYRFHESNTGGLYEPADDIYMQKVGDYEVHYWTGSSTKPANKKSSENPTGYEVIDSTSSSNIIRMENVPIPGIKPVIAKTKMDGTTITVGDGEKDAVFSLYAADGTEILSKFVVTNGQVTLDFNQEPYKVYNPRYIENGYLKPGEYYLKEISAPTGYEPAMAPLHFEVIENSDGTFEAFVNMGGETIKNVMFCNNQYSTNYKVNKMTFHLANGETSIIENPTITEHVADYNHYIQLPEQTKGVVAISIEAVYKEGQTSGDDKIKIVNSKGEKIWGDSQDGYDGNAPYCPVNGNGVYTISADTDTKTDISAAATASVDELDTTNVTKGNASLMSLAMKQTGVRVLADETYSNPYVVTIIDQNKSVELPEYFKNVTVYKIEMTLSGSNSTTFQFKLNDQSVGPTSNSTSLTIEENIPSELTSVGINYQGWMQLTATVKIHYRTSSDEPEETTPTTPVSTDSESSSESSGSSSSETTPTTPVSTDSENSSESSGGGSSETTTTANGGSSSEKYYLLDPHTFDSSELGQDNVGYTYTGNYKNVTEIQVDISYDGAFGMRFTAENGDTLVDDPGWMATNDNIKPKEYLSSIKFNKPTDITSLQFWNIQLWPQNGDFVINAIRLYYDDSVATEPAGSSSETSGGGSSETTTTTSVPLISSPGGNDIKIKNKEIGNVMKLKVEKKWAGDRGITEFRKTVTIQLKRKTVNADGTIESEIGADANGFIECNPYIVDGTPTGGVATLTEANDWQYIWENLPMYVNGVNKDNGLYYYTVAEADGADGYTSEVESVEVEENGEKVKVPLSFNQGGTITVTNTADTVNIPIQKLWSYAGYSKSDVFITNSITVKLQAKIDGENWTDLPGKTLTLTSKGCTEGEDTVTYHGEFKGLPKGYEYRIVEVKPTFGWEDTYPTQVVRVSDDGKLYKKADDAETEIPKDKGFEVTNTFNVDKGSLKLQKLWDGETGTRPYSVMLKLYRSSVAPSYAETDAPYTDKNIIGETNNDYKNDYKRLLQHSLYFYDANMCGDDVAENSALAWRTNCHVGDEVPGGYHDAGDHVMFGLPQGYTASMLSWIYLEFFKDNTTTNDDNGADKNSDQYYKMYNEEANHLETILKRFYEFFENSVQYGDDDKITKILVQKGDGEGDHVEWCAPEHQSEDTRIMIWSEYGSDIAYEYAAALALGYLNFGDEDYLNLAEKLYEFAEGTSPYSNTFYPQGSGDGDDKALAAAWIYKAKSVRNNPDLDSTDNKKKYLDARTTEAGKLEWDGVYLAAAAATAYDTDKWDKVTAWIDSNYIGEDYYSVHPWGTARFNAMAQTATLIAAKHVPAKKDSYLTWVKGQMSQLLGDNDWKDEIVKNSTASSAYGECDNGTIDRTGKPICLVTNFVPEGFDVDTPQAAHHRAASGWDTHEEYRLNCGYDEDGYTLIGALAGGPAFGSHDDGKQVQMYNYNHDHPLAVHTYIDDLHDYCCNEVAIDYNSGLVGAAAGLYYFEGTGARSTMIEGVEYGSYGLTGTPTSNVNYGNESPVDSVITSTPSVATVDVENLETNFKAFAFNPTAISINEDSTDGNVYSYVEYNVTNYVHNHDITFEVANVVNSKKIEYVDFVYDRAGNFKGFTRLFDTTNANIQQQYDNDHFLENGILRHRVNGTNGIIQKIEYKSWGEELTLKKIRFYYIDPNKFVLKPEKTDVAFGESIKLTPVGESITISEESEWKITGNATISKKDDIWYLTAGSSTGTVTVEATSDNGKTGKTTITIHDMEIGGDSEIIVGRETTLKALYAPHNAQYLKWETSNDEVATVDENGKVTPKKVGKVKIKLSAYNNEEMTGTPVKVDEITLNVCAVKRLENIGKVSDNVNKDFYLSELLPSGAILKSVTLHVTPTGDRIDGFKGGLMAGDEVNKNPWNQDDFNINLGTEGHTFTFTNLNGVDTSIHKFTFGRWGGGSKVNIDWIEFKYERESTYIELLYSTDENANTMTIRKGETREITVNAVVNEVTDPRYIGSIKIKQGETVVAEIESSSGTDGIYTIPAISEPGEYTIEAALSGDLSNKTDTLKLIVKDEIVIDGEEFMDYSDSQVFTVNNTIGNIKWSAENSDGVTVTDSEYTIEFKTSDGKEIATFFKKTGKLVTKDVDAEITLKATDSYNSSTDTITIQIKERPKVPQLPNEKFLDEVRTIEIKNENNNLWSEEISNLPMYDSKGNPYYYYFEEVAYKLSENDYKPLNAAGGYLINSGNTIYMPYVYYNNGIQPSTDNSSLATVGNKFVSETQGQLPSTGGSGVTTYYYLGGVIMLLSIAGFTGLKRRERKRRKE